jgi:hypothetical protein
MAVFTPSAHGKRRGFGVRPLAVPNGKDLRWDSPEILDAARKAGTSPAAMLERVNLARRMMASDQAARQFGGWVEVQNKVRAERGLPHMSDAEVETAWSQCVRHAMDQALGR